MMVADTKNCANNGMKLAKNRVPGVWRGEPVRGITRGGYLMSKTRGFLLAVAVATMAFTFSCSDDKDEGGDGTTAACYYEGVQPPGMGTFNFCIAVSDEKMVANCTTETEKFGKVGTRRGSCPSGESQKCDMSKNGVTAFIYAYGTGFTCEMMND